MYSRWLICCAGALLWSFSPGFLTAGGEHKFSGWKDYPVAKPADAPLNKPVENVIFMIGDGMGFPQISAAWVANRGKLNMDRFPVVGMARTWCANRLITDSAAAGTALASGTKTTKGTVGMNPVGEKTDSLVAHASRMGKSTGVVVTCDVTDATPAAFFSHVPNRSMGFEIASFLPESGIDFVAAGGLSKVENRPDGRNLLDEMEKDGYQIIRDGEKLAGAQGNKVCAILAPDHWPEPQKRGDLLGKAVMKGLDVLSRNEKGFFLMVEGSKIDKAAHKNNLALMLEETLDFDQTVGKVLAWAAAHPGTLVVVTADHHTGGLTLLGGDTKKGEVVCHFSSENHNEIAVPVFAFGAGAENFSGVYENTELCKKILEAMKKGAEACHHSPAKELGLEKKASSR